MITVQDLIFEYPGIRALDNLNFQVAESSITALVGPNGAGKTTLLRCIAALERPVKGSINVAGIDVLEQPRACHRIIGYLSDFYGLYQRLTVRQCLHFVARAQGIAEIDCEAAISEVSRNLKVEDRLEMRPSELSRGLRQRVAIAQAIIHKPRLLLLDEPASGLDPEARHELAQLFLYLQGQGLTLLVSSHILAELEAYCTDMLVLRGGRIIEQTGLSNASPSQTYKLSLAEPFHALSPVLQAIEGVGVVKIEQNQTAWLRVPDDERQRHVILKALLAHGLPVCEFSRDSRNLQEAYLQTIRQSL
ncbi:ABC transporter ATP-binding protein [Methylomonas sp. MgM2]